MPSLINAQPLGLLSLLGIKSTGDNPRVLPDFVQPTITLDELYGFATSEYVAGSVGSITVAGVTPAFLTVPPGQAWLVHEVGYQSIAVLAASTTIRLAAAVFSQSSQQIILSPPSETFTTGQQIFVAMNRPVIVPPNFNLGLAVSQATLGTAPTILATARITRLAV